MFSLWRENAGRFESKVNTNTTRNIHVSDTSAGSHLIPHCCAYEVSMLCARDHSSCPGMSTYYEVSMLCARDHSSCPGMSTYYEVSMLCARDHSSCPGMSTYFLLFVCVGLSTYFLLFVCVGLFLVLGLVWFGFGLIWFGLVALRCILWFNCRPNNRHEIW